MQGSAQERLHSPGAAEQRQPLPARTGERRFLTVPASPLLSAGPGINCTDSPAAFHGERFAVKAFPGQ